MKLKRRTVIAAIRREPLCAGVFAKASDHLPEGECRVCAVGAVLRKVGVRDRNINEVATNLVIGRHDHMVALSDQFERMANNGWPRTGQRKVFGKLFREALVQWVKDNLPAEFDVTGLESFVDKSARKKAA